MKIARLRHGVSIAAIILIAAGCGKTEDAESMNPAKGDSTTPPAPQSETAAKVESNLAGTGADQEEVKQQVQSVAIEAKETLAATTEEVAAQAQTLSEQAQTQTTALIEKAKTLIGEEQYQKAIASLGQLTNAKLTPEQQQIVADLKAKAEKMLTEATQAEGEKALGNLLGGQK